MNNNTNIEFITGWLEAYKSLGKIAFGKIRTFALTYNFVVKEQSIIHKLNNVSIESVLTIKGYIQDKISKDKKKEKEILVANFKIISPASQLPFQIDKSDSLSENNFYKYRYLTMRNSSIKQIIIKRSLANKFIRDFLCNENFLEIETPLLSTPNFEGSKEFLIPYKISKKSIYSLSQSPQIYKQLIMCSGFEKYFQIVKCFRDEKSRNNRQPEFSQLDIEISFLKINDIIVLINKLFKQICENVFNINSKKILFKKISFNDAINKYGSDAPDLRFNNEITKIDDYYFLLFENKLINSENKSKVDIINSYYPDVKIDIYRSKKEAISSLNSKVCKKLFASNLSFNKGTILIFKGKNNRILNLIGKIRVYLGESFQLFENDIFCFAWVLDWPLFLKDKANNFVPSHHPFVLPQDENLVLQSKSINNLFDAKSYSYDITLNGIEVGGGSLRINNPKVQEKIFKLLNFSNSQIDNNFGYFLEALSYGTPPHGGIAIGLDRLYSLLLQKNNIRSVILFPKLSNGNDSLNNKNSYLDEFNYLKEIVNDKN